MPVGFPNLSSNSVADYLAPNPPVNPTPNVASTVTLSNLGQTSSSITNPNQYPFVVSSAPDTSHFTYIGGQPSVRGTTYPSYTEIASQYPTDINAYGSLCVEFEVNALNMEVVFSGNGFATSVEIDGVLQAVFNGTLATAQGVTGTTIQLAAGSSSTNGYYNGQYVYIYSATTGAGQYGFITSYVGSTTTATISTAWGTTPTGTVQYLLTPSPQVVMGAPSTGSFYFPKFTFSTNNPRSSHTVRIYSGNPLIQINVDSSGYISKSNAASKPNMVMVADSFGGTNAADISNSYVHLLPRALGYTPILSNVGSTGFVSTDGGLKLNYQQRVCPGPNAYYIRFAGATGGTWGITQGGVSLTGQAYNISQSTLQTNLNSTFGSGQFQVVSVNNVNNNSFVIIGTGVNNSNTAPMTFQDSLTGKTAGWTAGVFPYLGDVAPNLQTDVNGNVLPFVILLQNSYNDNSQTTALTTAIQNLITAIQTQWPMATILVTGCLMSSGPLSTPFLAMETAVEAGVVSLPKTPTGKSAYLQMYNASTGVGYLNGTTNVSTQSGTAGVMTDACVGNDGVHPFGLPGHFLIRDTLIPKISTALRVNA